MNLLKTLLNWILRMMRCSPRMPVSISELEKPLGEDCCETGECETDTEEVVPVVVQEEPEAVEEEPVEVEEAPEPEPEPVEEFSTPSTVGSLIEQILLSEGISDTVISKHGIVESFEDWYEGAADKESVRESIQDFKAAQGGAIKAKLSRIQ
jgi:hypothetical protein